MYMHGVCVRGVCASRVVKAREPCVCVCACGVCARGVRGVCVCARAVCVCARAVCVRGVCEY